MMSPPPRPDLHQACQTDETVPSQPLTPSMGPQSQTHPPSPLPTQINDNLGQFIPAPSFDLLQWSVPNTQLPTQETNASQRFVPNSLSHNTKADISPIHFPYGRPSNPLRADSRTTAQSSSVAARLDIRTEPRSAAEQYIKSIEPKVTMGDKVLSAVAVLGEQLTALNATCQAIQAEHLHLRDKVHEIQIGQRALATRDEVTEEVAALLVPALQELAQTMQDRVDKSNASLPEAASNLTAQKIHMVLLGIKEVEKRQEALNGQAQQPLIGLLNYLITSLQPLQELTSTLSQLQGISESIRDIAIFKESMALLMVQASNPSPPPCARITNFEESPKSFEGIKKSLEELHNKVDGTVLIKKMDQVLAEMKRLDARTEGLEIERVQDTTQRDGSAFAGRRREVDLKLDDLHSTDAYTRLTRIERMLETIITKQDETNEQARSIRPQSSFRLQSHYNTTPKSTLAPREENSTNSLPPVVPFRLDARPSRRQQTESAASLTVGGSWQSPNSSQDVFGRKQAIPQKDAHASVKIPYKRDAVFKRSMTLAIQPVGHLPKKPRKSSTDSVIRTRAQKRRQREIGDLSPFDLTLAPPKSTSRGSMTQDDVARGKGSNEPIVIDDSSSEERGQVQTQDDTQGNAQDRIGSPDDITVLSKQLPAEHQASGTPSPELTLESLLAETQAVGAITLGSTHTQSSLIEGQPQETRSSMAESHSVEEVFLPGSRVSSLGSHRPNDRLRSKTSGSSDGRGPGRDKRTLNLGSDTE